MSNKIVKTLDVVFLGDEAVTEIYVAVENKKEAPAMRKFKFKGYQDRYVYYGEGKFTVGKAYAAEKICYFSSFRGSGTPDALFIDDEGVALWEELHHFEEVFDDAK